MDYPKGETIPLNISGEHRMGTYESLVSKDNSIIYCCHGKAADECCQNGSIGSKSDGNSKIFKQESILSDKHCHDEHEIGVDKAARRRLIIASILCLFFMIAEAIGGILANSLAVATDAAHLLADFASFMISLLSLWVASRPATKRMSFGWYRAEVIGALTSVLLIWVVTGVLVYMAVERIISKKFEVKAEIMLITASLGVAVNIIMGIALQAGGVSHGHSHGDTPKAGHQHGGAGKDNINVRAAFIHVIGDFIQSLGVLVAALIIYFKRDFGIADPICTFLFSVLVLFSTVHILKETLNVLMEGSPRGMNFQEVMKLINTTPGVVKVHNLRMWSLSMDKTALSAHIVAAKGENPIVILKKASNLIRQELGVFDLTLQIEEYRDDMLDCNKCKEPQD